MTGKKMFVHFHRINVYRDNEVLCYPFNEVIPARIISSTSRRFVAITVLKNKNKHENNVAKRCKSRFNTVILS